jgi:hypothetical protein
MVKSNRVIGLLRVSKANPRYFEDASTGRIVYLTGTHTWGNMQDRIDGRDAFDYPAYLGYLERHHMNFIRLWAWEHARWSASSSEDTPGRQPLPYARTGPGLAADGLPRFDLDKFSEDYFERIADRVSRAGERGIYASVMLFSGCSIGNRGWPEKDTRTGLPVRNPWDSHPFHRDNNVNSVDGDPEGTGQGWELRNAERADFVARQKAFVRKVVDTVNRFDNVLYEILNEDPYDTRAWQYEMVHAIHEYERGKPKQHPVGMTISWKQPNEALFDGPADWVSPYYNEDEAIDPLTADGRKVWIADTDHVHPHMGVTMDFAWKAFLRGANVISMDSRKAGESWEAFRKKAGGNVEKYEPTKESTLVEDGFQPTLGDLALMHTRRYAERMDLASAVPQSALSSTGYCLAAPGREYLVYQPGEGSFTVDLGAAGGNLSVEWFDPVACKAAPGGCAPGGGVRGFTAPFAPSVLYLKGEKT